MTLLWVISVQVIFFGGGNHIFVWIDSFKNEVGMLEDNHLTNLMPQGRGLLTMNKIPQNTVKYIKDQLANC